MNQLNKSLGVLADKETISEKIPVFRVYTLVRVRQ